MEYFFDVPSQEGYWLVHLVSELTTVDLINMLPELSPSEAVEHGRLGKLLMVTKASSPHLSRAICPPTAELISYRNNAWHHEGVEISQAMKKWLLAVETIIDEAIKSIG